MKEVIEKKLSDLRDQMKQLQDNANAVGGAIQVLETLLAEATKVPEGN